MSKRFLITTAIDYANGSPHIGHAYEKILTDVIARYKRLSDVPVHFVTGLDEHGQKVQMSAEKKGIEPLEICDSLAEEFQSLCQRLNISNDDYIRTTENRHKKVVQTLLQKLFDEGKIYKADYNGYYSVRQEQFVTEKEKVNGQWPKLYGEVNEITESNYFFKLSEHQDWLIDTIRSDASLIYPRFRSADVLNFLKEPLNDLCISRPKERLSWGIELPFDDGFVTYVWFDALVNYITAAGYGTESFEDYWPADYHVIGKDILSPPHAVYWPIMLKALGIPLPKHYLVHGWWLNSGSKMSKSDGDVVNPLDLINTYGADAFRYFVICEMNVGQDSDFSEELFQKRYNSDLANDLGNLVSRLLNMGHRFADGIIPKAEIEEAEEKVVLEHWKSLKSDIFDLYDTFQFHKALEKIFSFIAELNRYTEMRAPWKLAKSEDAKDKLRLATTLATMSEGLRLASILLQPVMPQTAENILNSLGQKSVELFSDHVEWGTQLAGSSYGEKSILFPKKDR
jgi:methionyl-tRNA synthetase